VTERAARIFVIEDHPLMREVLRDYLGAMPGVEICGEATSGEEALERLDEVEADLLLVDTTLGGMNGINFVKRVSARWKDLPCLMLSGHGQEGYVERALHAGARGYVLKGNPAELPRAIEKVLGGEVYLSPKLT